ASPKLNDPAAAAPASDKREQELPPEQGSSVSVTAAGQAQNSNAAKRRKVISENELIEKLMLKHQDEKQESSTPVAAPPDEMTRLEAKELDEVEVRESVNEIIDEMNITLTAAEAHEMNDIIDEKGGDAPYFASEANLEYVSDEDDEVEEEAHIQKDAPDADASAEDVAVPIEDKVLVVGDNARQRPPSSSSSVIPEAPKTYMMGPSAVAQTKARGVSSSIFVPPSSKEMSKISSNSKASSIASSPSWNNKPPGGSTPA
ncbi:unnamed protein product, partial [Amoebophrya sp. A25]